MQPQLMVTGVDGRHGVNACQSVVQENRRGKDIALIQLPNMVANHAKEKHRRTKYAQPGNVSNSPC